MKKFLIIGLIVGLALIVVGGVGVVFARVQEANSPTTVTVTTSQNGGTIVRQFGEGRSLQQNGNGVIVGPGGMMGQYGYQTGPNGQNEGKGYGYGPGGMMGGNQQGYGPGGMMGGRGGMMGGRGGLRGEGFMHDYMISAFASSVGLTVDEVNTRLSKGDTPKEIALAQGKTEAELPALWTQVRQDALKAAVAAGVITQAQADVMLQHMNNYTGEGFGPGFGAGNCPMMDGDETQQP
jgi:hypothetical protein